MKPAFLFIICVALFLSCTGDSAEFNGFGGLDIGANFKSLPNAKDFTKILDDEFNIARCKISDDIGVVSNLNVSLQDGKISEVSFLSTDGTNTGEIEKVTRQMTRPKMDIQLDFLELYVSSDGKIFFSIERGQGMQSRYPKHVAKYSYFDQAAVLRNNQEVMDRIGRPTTTKISDSIRK